MQILGFGGVGGLGVGGGYHWGGRGGGVGVRGPGSYIYIYICLFIYLYYIYIYRQYIYIGWYHYFSVLKSRPRMLHSPVVLDSPTRNCGVVFSACLISGVLNFDSSLHIQKDSFKKTQWTAPHTFLVDSVLQMLHAQSVVASQEFKTVLLQFHCPSERVDMIRPSASKFVHTGFFSLFPIVRLCIKMQHPPTYRSCPIIHFQQSSSQRLSPTARTAWTATYLASAAQWPAQFVKSLSWSSESPK